MERSGEFRIIIGNTSFDCLNFPCSILRTEVRELLWLTKVKGHIQINAYLLDERGIIMVQLKDNKFYVNRNQTYRPPDTVDPTFLQSNPLISTGEPF